MFWYRFLKQYVLQLATAAALASVYIVVALLVTEAAGLAWGMGPALLGVVVALIQRFTVVPSMERLLSSIESAQPPESVADYIRHRQSDMARSRFLMLWLPLLQLPILSGAFLFTDYLPRVWFTIAGAVVVFLQYAAGCTGQMAGSMLRGLLVGIECVLR